MAARVNTNSRNPIMRAMEWFFGWNGLILVIGISFVAVSIHDGYDRTLQAILKTLSPNIFTGGSVVAGILLGMLVFRRIQRNKAYRADHAGEEEVFIEDEEYDFDEEEAKVEAFARQSPPMTTCWDDPRAKLMDEAIVQLMSTGDNPKCVSF